MVLAESNTCLAGLRPVKKSFLDKTYLTACPGWVMPVFQGEDIMGAENNQHKSISAAEKEVPLSGKGVTRTGKWWVEDLMAKSSFGQDALAVCGTNLI
jgi:hypothetical protein